MKKTTDIDKSQWTKEGFLFQLAKDKYLLGSGPFRRASTPQPNTWSLFHPPFFTSKKSAWFCPTQTHIYSRKELKTLLRNSLSKQQKLCRPDEWKWKEPRLQDFKNFFMEVQKKIQQGKLQKVVPVLFETSSYKLQTTDILILLNRLISFQMGSSYAFWRKKQAVIGNSPEHLFQKQGLKIKTMALAGTAKDKHHDLLKDEKEKWEHLLVVEDIKSVLTKYGNLRIEKIKIHSIGKIQHLKTNIQLNLKKHLSFEKLCRLLHPTAAVGGVPRKTALTLLKNFHNKYEPRYAYAAPFGVCKGDTGFCLVSLRNMQFIKDKVFLGSGGGLVKGSNLKQEWKELKLKRQFIKNILW